MLKGLLKNFTKTQSAHISHKMQPIVIPRAEHTISRQSINPNALKVLYRLHNAGYSAFLVGGCVRDLLLNKQPKDFDIATDALPEEVRKLFKNCRLIGKRFRLAHIVFGKEIIEVATFRTHHKDAQEKQGHSHQGMIIRDNVYGTIEDDAWRRDFTVNALYYNIADFSVLDYTNGMPDLKAKLLRMIGNPEQRFHEDPIRILRAIRFVSKLNLDISPETESSMSELSYLLQHVSPARVFQEVLKFFQEGATLNTFRLLQKYDLFKDLFPQTAELIAQPIVTTMIEEALTATDKRTQEGKTISPAFLFAVFLWYPVSHLVQASAKEDLPPQIIFENAIKIILRKQTEALTIPRTLLISVHDICFLQHRFTCRYGTTPYRLLDHPRFRAAYDLLLLRASAGEPIQELSTWWMQFYAGNHEQREALLKAVDRVRPAKTGSARRRSRRSRLKAKPTTT